jgi:hypothetical protein
MLSPYETTELLFSVAIVFCVIQVLQFYGIGLDKYAVYLAFYIFILLTKFILPTNVDSI